MPPTLVFLFRQCQFCVCSQDWHILELHVADDMSGLEWVRQLRQGLRDGGNGYSDLEPSFTILGKSFRDLGPNFRDLDKALGRSRAFQRDLIRGLHKEPLQHKA